MPGYLGTAGTAATAAAPAAGPAAPILAGIGTAANIATSILGSKEQADAEKQAGQNALLGSILGYQLAGSQIAQNRSDLSPYMGTGYGALAEMAKQLGVTPRLDLVNQNVVPGLQQFYDNPEAFQTLPGVTYQGHPVTLGPNGIIKDQYTGQTVTTVATPQAGQGKQAIPGLERNGHTVYVNESGGILSGASGNDYVLTGAQIQEGQRRAQAGTITNEQFMAGVGGSPGGAAPGLPSPPTPAPSGPPAPATPAAPDPWTVLPNNITTGEWEKNSKSGGPLKKAGKVLSNASPAALILGKGGGESQGVSGHQVALNVATGDIRDEVTGSIIGNVNQATPHKSGVNVISGLTRKGHGVVIDPKTGEIMSGASGSGFIHTGVSLQPQQPAPVAAAQQPLPTAQQMSRPVTQMDLSQYPVAGAGLPHAQYGMDFMIGSPELAGLGDLSYLFSQYAKPPNDSQLVQFMANPGERVTVTPPSPPPAPVSPLPSPQAVSPISTYTGVGGGSPEAAYAAAGIPSMPQATSQPAAPKPPPAPQTAAASAPLNLPANVAAGLPIDMGGSPEAAYAAPSPTLAPAAAPSYQPTPSGGVQQILTPPKPAGTPATTQPIGPGQMVAPAAAAPGAPPININTSMGGYNTGVTGNPANAAPPPGSVPTPAAPIAPAAPPAVGGPGQVPPLPPATPAGPPTTQTPTVPPAAAPSVVPPLPTTPAVPPAPLPQPGQVGAPSQVAPQLNIPEATVNDYLPPDFASQPRAVQEQLMAQAQAQAQAENERRRMEAFGQTSGTQVAAATQPATALQRYGSFYESPDYNFVYDEAIRAVRRNAAAGGRLYSGRALRELARYASGLASSEYGNYFSRLQSLAGLQATSTNAALGSQLAANAGNQIATGYTNQGSAIANAGASNAAGIVGAGNAAAQGLSDIAALLQQGQ